MNGRGYVLAHRCGASHPPHHEKNEKNRVDDEQLQRKRRVAGAQDAVEFVPIDIEHGGSPQAIPFKAIFPPLD
ncbi:MAG: hypothetical protein HC855_09965 [Rhizobiales bacterium]|nr:hypothetical protein [Hyphomicrobiales bacterium]